jgi:hypothetical protein
MVFFLMVLKAFVAATRAVVCSWAQSPRVYTGLTTLIVVPSFTLVGILPLVEVDVLKAIVAAVMVILLTVILVGGLGWMISASEAMQVLSSQLFDLEDMLDELIVRLNPVYGIDTMGREQGLNDKVDLLKKEIEGMGELAEGFRMQYLDASYKEDKAEEKFQRLLREVKLLEDNLGILGQQAQQVHLEHAIRIAEQE